MRSPKFYLSGLENINELIGNILTKNPKYILGLGEYTGKDQDKIRIETVCNNKFRNRVLGKELITLNINPFFQPFGVFKFSKGIGNSYCNLISFKIKNLIIKNNLQTQYTFLHIPKSFNTDKASLEIEKILLQLG